MYQSLIPGFLQDTAAEGEKVSTVHGLIHVNKSMY